MSERMYLSVAKMERASSLPDMKRDLLPECKAPEPLATATVSRRPSSSVNLNIGQTLKSISAPEPVLVKAPTMGMVNPVPAVRITYTEPTLQTHIVPLSRVEMGEVWNTPSELALLEVTVLPRGWHTALDTFTPLVEYSETYLRHILSVLRTMQFMNDKPLDLALWKRACKSTNDMLYVVITCPKCKTIRYLSMRTLYMSSTKQKPLNITCADLDLMCNQHWEEVIDATLGSTTTESSVEDTCKPTKVEHYTMNDDVETQIVPYKTVKISQPDKAAGHVTWSQVASHFTASQNPDAFASHHYHDPYESIEAAPDYFITGLALNKFSAPDPSRYEIDEYETIINTSAWREIFRDFTKWSDLHKEAQYNGEEDIASVLRWSTAMKSRFLSLYITNSIVRAELASATLTHRARSWWLAHRTRTPKLLITFNQLLEWIKRELVPHSSTSNAVNAWAELSYTGDVNKYINDLERLINHFPLRRESIIIMATKPLGKDIQNRVQLMDLQYGPAGITIAQLKQVIKSTLSIGQYSRSITRDRAVPFQPRPVRPNIQPYSIRRDNIPHQREARLNAFNTTNNPPNNTPSNRFTTDNKSNSNQFPNQRNPSNNSFTSNAPTFKRKIGVGPTPCFVCGSDKHAWIDCVKKKKGKCACCGSEAHLTRMCAQRYFPEVRMSFHQYMTETDHNFEYILENSVCDETESEDTPNEIEECENEIQINETAFETAEEEELSKELEKLEITFHAQSMCLPSDQTVETDKTRQSPSDSIAWNMKDVLPWQLPSPRDYEGYSLEEELPVKTFRLTELESDDISDSDHEPPPLPDNEATVYSTRLPRRRFKFKFHSDQPETPWAKFDSKWESQLNLAETDKKLEQMKREMKELKVIPEEEDESQDIPSTQPLTQPYTNGISHPQSEFEHIPKPEGDPDGIESNIPPHVSVWKKFGAPLQPHWNEIFKVLHNDSFPHLMPIQAPNKLGQLLYKFNIEGYEVTTLLDLGASHSFITRAWASNKGLDLTPIRPPRPVGLFSGQKNYIRHMAMATTLKFRDHARTWRFYVIDSAPFPAILGADAILSWPIFFSPLDHRIFIIPDLFHSKKNAGDLGGVYQYWHKKDVDARGHCLAHRAFFKRDGPATLLDQTPSTSEDESYRARHAPVPICFMNMEDDDMICAPWCNFDTSVLWLHMFDGLSRGIECEEENLLQIHSVTASGEEEAKNLQDFRNSIAPELLLIVDKFPALFAPPDSNPPSRPVKHYIYVSPDTVPAARRAYRLGDKKRDAMLEQMRELIDKQWVVPSASPWAAPILFVPKDDGTKLRMCIDFRDLNALTKKDAFPLPRLDLLLHKAAKAKYFSNIDLASGFHQIEVHPTHRELTAFILPEPVDGCSLWEWKVMPFGLINAPSTFQRAMSYALRGCEEFTAVYIDDVLIFSETPEEHLKHLEMVFQKLQDSKYHVRLAKCKFMTNQVKFLGHVLTDKGIQPADTRQRDLDMFQPPFETAKKVRSFLGLIMWYKSFIPHVSTIAAPLFPLTSAKKKIQWTEEATLAVNALKEAVLAAPTLIRFDRSLPTRITTDASAVGVGAVLEQLATNEWKPVAFWSRKLKDPETRYSATDIEWLAVVDAVTLIWRHFLEDIPFTVRSDHKALERKLLKSAHDPPISSRQARWIERLMPFALTYEYIPGDQNQVADALSRYPHTASLNTITVMHSKLAGILPRIKLAAEQDAVYQRILQQVSGGSSTRYRVEDDILILGESNIYIPEDNHLKTILLAEAHDTIFGGHFGIEKTLEKVKRYWYWPGLHRDVEEYVKTCTICQKTKHSTQRPAGLLQPIRAQFPWEIITMDFVSGLAPGGITDNTMCLVIVDKFSKYILLESVPESIDAEQTADILVKRVISQFGIPEKVITDRGPQFAANLWHRVLTFLGSKPALASAHHPQTDGQTERAVQTVKRLVSAFANEQEEIWEELLPMFQFALNDAFCESTASTPFRTLYGYDPISPMRLITRQSREATQTDQPLSPSEWEEKTVEQLNKVWQFIRDHQQEVAQRMKMRYDKGRSILELQAGDLVLVSTKSHRLLEGHRKHRQRFVGPYVVHSKINDNAYKLSGLPPGMPTDSECRISQNISAKSL